MRVAVLGALAGAGMLWAAVGALDRRGEAFAQPSVAHRQAVPSNGLTALPGPVGKKGQLLTVIDLQRQVIAVYHIELETGKIALRSVRNIQWDLQMTYLDNEGLLPQEIQGLLEPR